MYTSIKQMHKCIHKGILLLVALCLLPGPVWGANSWGAKNTGHTSVERTTTEPTTIEQVLQYEIQKNRQAILKKQQADMGIQQPEALANEIKYKFDKLLSAELSTGTPRQRHKKIEQLIAFQKHMQGLQQNFKAYKENKYNNKNKIKAEVAHHTEQIEKFLATDLGKKIAHLWNKESKKHSQHYSKQRAAFIYGELSGQDVKSLDLKQLPTLDKAKILSEFKDILPPNITNTRKPAQFLREKINMPPQAEKVLTTFYSLFIVASIAALALGAFQLVASAWIALVTTTAVCVAMVYVSSRISRKNHADSVLRTKLYLNTFFRTWSKSLQNLWNIIKNTKAILPDNTSKKTAPQETAPQE